MGQLILETSFLVDFEREENGLLIGANDLWIAATALAYRMPVVTRKVDHYRRVPDLQVQCCR